MKRVIITDPIAREGIEQLKKDVEVTVKTNLCPEQLREEIGDYQGLIVRSSTRVDAQLIARAEKLEVIGRA